MQSLSNLLQRLADSGVDFVGIEASRAKKGNLVHCREVYFVLMLPLATASRAEQAALLQQLEELRQRRKRLLAGGGNPGAMQAGKEA